MKHSTMTLPGSNSADVLKRNETHVQDMECKVREWTDNIKIEDELRFRHTVLVLAPSLSVEP